VSDSLWFSNLLLLGFADHDSPVAFSPTMFDYPNPVAFQQVFFFLFGLLSQDRTKMEFRDCWPILDKKQEAEFRRKVVNILKEYQKDFPMDMPYTNPSLFQSPGGRRFVGFLQTFSNFVMKMQIENHQQVLSKPSTKNGKLKLICFKASVKSTKAALDNAVADEAAVEEIIAQSKLAIEKIGAKFFNIKRCIENNPNTEYDGLKAEHAEWGIIDQAELLGQFDEKCAAIKQLQETYKADTADHEEVWDSIMMVVDDSVLKPRLNFGEIPKQLVASDDLKMTYEHMITKVLSTLDRVLEFRSRDFPVKEMAQGALIFTSQAHQLTETQAELATTVGKMMENVQTMLHTSSQIDWANCELSIPSSRSSQPVLLPPTPSMLDNLKRSDVSDPKADIHSRLQFMSPCPATPGPNLSVPATTGITVTPISTGQVTRRFPRRITPDQSPLLRQSLIQSTLLRAGGLPEEDENKETSGKVDTASLRQDSQSSLSVFSPVLSSTKSPHDTFSRPTSCLGLSAESRPSSILGQSLGGSSSTFGSLRAVAEASLEHDTTQSKIEMYKKILLSAKTTDKPASESRSSLCSAWSLHRQSLSPQTRQVKHSSSSSNSSSPATPQQNYSPMLASRTPDMSSLVNSISSPVGMDQATRLDQLMSSLTFSDTSLDLSLGRMSFGGEELLSPHCP